MPNLYLIGIVTYNGENYLHKCLDSLLQFADNFDILIIDNASTDNTIKILESYQEKISYKLSNKNVGFGQANNKILEYSIEHDYDYVYLINQDTYLLDDSTKNLIDYANKNEGMAIYSPLHFSSDHTTLDKPFSLYIDPKSKDFLEVNNNSVSCNFINAAAWLIPVKILDSIGGFNPYFFHYGEDRDLANRLVSKGGKFAVIKSAKIVHDRTTTNVKELYKHNPTKYIASYLIFFKTYATSLKHNLFIGYFLVVKSSIHLFFKNVFRFEFKVAFGMIVNLFKCLFQLPTIIQNRKKAQEEYAFLVT